MTASSTQSRARKGLSRELIVDAAIALIERDGPGALSMRRLGGELDVEAMSLYNHVANRDELLIAIGERLLEPLGVLSLDGPWRACARRFASALRAVALQRPATFKVVGLQPLDATSSLESVERLLAVFVGQGFAPAEALAIYRALAGYARGYALAETAGFTVDGAAPAGRARLAALHPGSFPILHGRAEELAELDPDGGFEHGLRALLDGFANPR